MTDDPLTFEERVAGHLPHKVWGRFAARILKWRGIEIPRTVEIRGNLRLPHGAVGLVVHPDTKLGAGVKLYQGVTLGRSDTYLPRDMTSPGGGIVIGDDVVIGANTVVLFRGGQKLTIGDGAVLGAGSVVISDVPSGEIWAGSPAVKKGTRPHYCDAQLKSDA